ncbi:hypothetical protein DRJ22_00800 [Candidatus Woesearchaeota archaeon]|nr:MAG: hypothetical protein B6U93_02120 [Candidatus Woesearchaeota archaeon ex4484_78]RLE46896.1 MAG: hypothetical protein DRJ22_00800 [Candidatus Woesearchaeota archaeon]
MAKIILATSSPYRQEAFRFLGFDFVVRASDVDEYFDARPDSPEELVLFLAKLKADAVAEHYDSGIVVGFDSVGWFNSKVLEKPESREEAFQRLKSLSGNAFKFYTGIHMKNLDSGKEISRVVVTIVEMRDLTDSEINKYLDQDSEFTAYALGFDPLEHFSSSFIKKVSGSYNNLTRGIPLEVVVEMLSSVGFEV